MFETIAIVLGILFPSMIAIYSVHRKYSKQLKEMQENNTTLKTTIQSEAQRTFEEWKQTQLVSIQDQYKTQVENASQEYAKQLEEHKAEIRKCLEDQFKVDTQKWKEDEESKIREDAIERSQSVIRGHVTEQLAPYLPEFDLNPKDARFVGSPIDFIVFDGLSEGDLKRIVIIEVKSGKSQVNQRERQVKEIVKNSLIEYREMRIKKEEKPEDTIS